jgi:hypothetical protein
VKLPIAEKKIEIRDELIPNLRNILALKLKKDSEDKTDKTEGDP